MKLLTITVPSYNVEKTLKSTLSSLCVDEIIEKLDIIIVDDGSTDDTALIAKGCAARYPDSVKVVTKANGGHGSAVNTGIEAAQGLYFKVVDGDDRLDREGLTALIGRLEVTSADLLAAPYEKVAAGNESNRIAMNFNGVECGVQYDFNELPLNKNIYFGIHSITIKTSILKQHDLKLQEHTYYVDAEYGLLPVPFVQTVEFLDRIVYLYFVGNPGQSISQSNFVKRYDDHYRVVKRMTEYYKTCGAGDAQLKYMNSVLQKLCFTNYMLSAFYDDDIKRGRSRASEFDAWLRNNGGSLYNDLNKSLYIRFLRITGFKLLPRGSFIKGCVKGVYGIFKPLFKKRKKLTY